jgi:hypothetical protein
MATEKNSKQRAWMVPIRQSFECIERSTIYLFSLQITEQQSCLSHVTLHKLSFPETPSSPTSTQQSSATTFHPPCPSPFYFGDHALLHQQFPTSRLSAPPLLHHRQNLSSEDALPTFSTNLLPTKRSHSSHDAATRCTNLTSCHSSAEMPILNCAASQGCYTSVPVPRVSMLYRGRTILGEFSWSGEPPTCFVGV